MYMHRWSTGYKDLFQKMDTCFLTRKDIIVGGDFNCSLERETFSLPFRTFIKKYGLIDVMGKLLGKQVGYTWKNTRGVKSRLDYILVGKKCKIIEGKTMPALFTDHQAVDVELEIVGPDFGKGYWKFNNDVLAEKAYREGFMKIFPIWAEMKSLYSNNVVWWEDMKKKIKKFTVEYCTERAKVRKKEFDTIQKEIEIIYVMENRGREIKKEGYLENLKMRQEELLERKARAVIYKLKQEEYEENEKCSSYFFSKMKTRDKRGIITELERDGKVIRGKDDLLKTVEEYYGKLFTKESLDEGKGEVFIRSLRRRLPEEENGKLGGGIDSRGGV